ncbi:MAG: hypothetical protein J0H18_17145 [Rhizobiales bacterium]|nr:hypothetical protein [Hyphomicrobiales bacterium]OJY06236.1 MAG: hypothetical protein BGP07_01235 [Rhizobiales bacterium 63-22]
MASEQLISTIEAYFLGERQEGLWVLLMSTLLLALAGVLWFSQRDTFARGLGIIIVLGVVVFAIASVVVVQRSAPQKTTLVTAIESGDAASAIATETRRMDAVMKGYPRFRAIVSVLALIGVALALFSRNGTANGVAAGFAVLFFAQTMIDHYSEVRARHYLNVLQSHAALTP